MFNTRNTGEGTNWARRMATADKPQDRPKGGSGNQKNTSSAGTFPKDRTKITRGYGTKKG